jgi:hypothetical protein
MTARLATGVLLLAASIVAAACGSSTNDTKGGTRDAGLGGARAAGGGSNSGTGGISGGASGGASAGGGGTGGLSITMVRCGDAVCSPLKEASTESFACCNDTGGCGLRLPISSKCFSKNQPGHTNPVCKAYEVSGKVQFTGCCSPTGCGALVTTAGIGCVPNPDLDLPPVSCVFDTIGGGGAGGTASSSDASPGAP